MTTASPPPGCPMHNGNPPATATDAPKQPAKCPVNHHSITTGAPLNPLNNMPELSDAPQPDQSMALPTDRVESTIPSGDASSSRWVYPSPQQFYNALRRKGWETPEDHIEVMVDIHNHLNEEAWREILDWERPHAAECATPRLLRLRGRPNDISPKSMWAQWTKGAPKPFDRHDWYVDRCGREVRYVIDYYEAPPEGDQPVFFLDVRPAIDSPTAAMDRMRAAFNRWWSPSSTQ
ncbi:cytochrome c/c1 heme-lyase [Blastocladiella britannica]|nr:cytochrome c/c1 heme-lyase [Blastocladiella britannica]